MLSCGVVCFDCETLSLRMLNNEHKSFGGFEIVGQQCCSPWRHMFLVCLVVKLLRVDVII